MAKSNWEKWRDKKAREAKRKLKKVNKVYLVLAVIALAVGFAASWMFLDSMCADDAFELNGQQIITVTEGDEYTFEDQGIKYISMGKDLSGDVKLESDIDFSNLPKEVGEYPIIYRAIGGRCDGQTLYRVIRIVPKEG